jgi:hypothetical protein
MYKVAALSLLTAYQPYSSKATPHDVKAGAFLPNGSRSVLPGEQPKTKKAQNKALMPHSGLTVSVPDIAYSDTYELN